MIAPNSEREQGCHAHIVVYTYQETCFRLYTPKENFHCLPTFNISLKVNALESLNTQESVQHDINSSHLTVLETLRVKHNALMSTAVNDRGTLAKVIFITLTLGVALARQKMGQRVKSDLRCRQTPGADVTGKKGKMRKKR